MDTPHIKQPMICTEAYWLLHSDEVEAEHGENASILVDESWFTPSQYRDLFSNDERNVDSRCRTTGYTWSQISGRLKDLFESSGRKA